MDMSNYLLLFFKHSYFERRFCFLFRNIDNELTNNDDTQIVISKQPDVAWAQSTNDAIIIVTSDNSSTELNCDSNTHLGCTFSPDPSLEWMVTGLPIFSSQRLQRRSPYSWSCPPLAGERRERSVESWEPTTCWWRHGHAGRTLCIHRPHLAATPKDEQ